MAEKRKKMKPVKAWAVVGKMTGNNWGGWHATREDARKWRKHATYPEHYRIARILITEAK
jgi:hypothetical protein